MEGRSKDQRPIILGVFAVIAIAIVAGILISRGGSGDDSSTASTAAAGGKPTCRKVEEPPVKTVSFKAPKEVVKKGEKATAVVETSCGTFKIDLATDQAAKTANSFAFLSEEGFYDDLTFHRIVPEFVIQGGDPAGDGSGGPGYQVVEKPPANLKYTKGVVAMAKGSTDPAGASGSQFYIVTGPQGEELPPEYALVGKVSEGLDVVEKIGEEGTPEEKPKQTIMIEKVTIEHG
jgi:peptidyl-prolyl cis-trans isomerase B (cyclophilin B)